MARVGAATPSADRITLLRGLGPDGAATTKSVFIEHLHSPFGMALVGGVLESHGFRVGILDQPEWRDPNAFRALGRPNLFWGITAGNMDSMVNRYTSDRKIRSDDAYTPGGVAEDLDASPLEAALGHVVTDPDLEQVAEDEDGVGIGMAQMCGPSVEDPWRAFGEMQVGHQVDGAPVRRRREDRRRRSHWWRRHCSRVTLVT